MTIDLKRIFKNMPTGIKLYSPLFGVCTLERVDTEGNIIVSFIDANGEKRYPVFNGNFGFLKDCNNGKLMIFPDKSETWEEWQKKLFKKGDFITDEYSNVLIYIDGTTCSSSIGKTISQFYDLSKYTYASDREIKEFKANLRNEGYKWNDKTLKLEPIIEKPNFKVGEVIKYRVKSDFDEDETFKIIEIKDNKYYFDDGSFAYIYTQNQFVKVGHFPIFKIGELIKNKNSNSYNVIENITDRGYIFKNGPNPILLFEFQNDWEVVYGEGENYCNYENCKTLIEHGFQYKGNLCDNLETYGFYSGENHDILVFDDYTDNPDDCIRISQNSAAKWIRKVYGIEIGASPLMDEENNKTVYIPYAQRYNSLHEKFINEIKFLEVIACEKYEDAIDDAIKIVFKKLI